MPRGRNVRCRLEKPIDTRTDTGGRTRIWPQLPEFGATLLQLSATEQELWERRVERAAYRLVVMARSIPHRYRDEVKFKNRVRIFNNRNELPEEVYEIVGVEIGRRAGRLKKFDMILGNVT